MALRCRTRVTAAHEVQIFCLIKWTLVVVKNYLPMDQFPFTLTEFSWSGFQVRIFKSYAFAASSLIIPYPHSLIPCLSVDAVSMPLSRWVYCLDVRCSRLHAHPFFASENANQRYYSALLFKRPRTLASGGSPSNSNSRTSGVGLRTAFHRTCHPTEAVASSIGQAIIVTRPQWRAMSADIFRSS